MNSRAERGNALKRVGEARNTFVINFDILKINEG
jgi:hypothetical protein